MTSKDALEFIKHSKNIDVIANEIKPLKDTTFKLQLDIIEKDLEVLEILKPRIHLTHSTLNGKKVVFIEATGFVFEDDKEHRLLKYWLRRK